MHFVHQFFYGEQVNPVKGENVVSYSQTSLIGWTIGSYAVDPYPIMPNPWFLIAPCSY
jgi:hypothetical protein